MEISSFLETKTEKKIPEIKPGDTVRVSYKIREGAKERVQSFQGVVISLKHGKSNASFIVRRISFGVGVERTFFFNSPNLEKVDVLRQARVRRARLYYLRKLIGSASRLQEKRREKLAAAGIEASTVVNIEEAAEKEAAPEATASEIAPKAGE